jgi:hypothetical protein
MAKSLNQLNEILDQAITNGDIDSLVSVVSENYYCKIDSKEFTDLQHFKKYLLEFFKTNKVIESTTTIVVESNTDITYDNDNIRLSIGKWNGIVVDTRSNKYENWEINWSDIRSLCHDNLWRILKTVGTVTIEEYK